MGSFAALCHPAKRGCAKQDGGQGGIAKTRFGVFSSSGKLPRIASLLSAPKTPSAFCRTWVHSPHPVSIQRISPRAGGLCVDGGQGGIRTHETVSRPHAFQACAFSHSAEGAKAWLYATFCFLRWPNNPISPKPARSIPNVSGSGTAAAAASVVTLSTTM